MNKTILLLGCVIGTSLQIIAQEKILTGANGKSDFTYNNGNIGIGISSALHGKLHINGNGSGQGINLWTNSGETTSRIWIDNQKKTFHLSKGDNPVNGITIGNSGLVGIGTTSPTSNLDVHTTDHNSATGIVISQGNLSNNRNSGRLFFENLGEQNNSFAIMKVDDRLTFRGNAQAGTSSGTEYFNIKNNGNVGIGTPNPEHGKLHINGNGSGQGINLWTNSGESTSRIWIDNQKKTFHLSRGENPVNGITISNSGLVGIGEIKPEHGRLHINGNGAGQGINLWTNSGESTSRIWIDNQKRTFHLSKGDNPVNGITISNNGLVGIGETNPDSKLAVNGKIHAKEVKVDLIGWSDFVFYDNYKLPTLLEVENHIKEKGHLKDIPSAKEVEKNGILLGEMDAKLLQKIEELTLYTIQQEKKIEEQADEIKELKNLNTKLIELQSRLEKLEAEK